MRILQGFLWGFLAVSSAHAESISGTYIGKGTNSAFLMQIVQSPGGQLTGRYEQTVLTADGKLTQTAEAVAGASDGQTVVLTFKPSELFSTAITASGTIEAGLLHLSSGNTGNTLQLNLSKSDEAAYQTLVFDLSNEGQRIIEARARSDELVRLNKLTNDMATYSATAEAQLSKFPPIEQRYRTLTEAMKAALRREGTIYGGGPAAVARSQISVQINQAGISAEQLHTSVANAKAEISEKIGPALRSAIYFRQRCQSKEALDNSNLHDACAKFLDNAEAFAQSVGHLDNAFNRAETVWEEEHDKQAKINQASELAAR